MNLRDTTPILAAMAFVAACAPDDPESVSEQQVENRHLNILYWQAVSILNPYLSGGTKDIEAASMVVEPLAHYDENGAMLPMLAAGIPTLEDGGVAEDLRSVTWNLKTDIKWSDGTPFTAHDVAFSGAYCLNEQAGCNALASFADVSAVEALDDHTVRITFDVAKPWPYGPFVGAITPIIQRDQFQNCLGAKAQQCTEQNFGPIGTGPFKVDEFRANDVISYSANEHYREPGKPWFRTATFKGGGDAASAARAVLETGEYDYAWNLQVEPEVLEQMTAAGRGQVLMGFGSQVERLVVNQTNDDSSLGEGRSLYLEGTNPHPFLADPVVRSSIVAGHRTRSAGGCGLWRRWPDHLQRGTRTARLRLRRQRGMQDARLRTKRTAFSTRPAGYAERTTCVRRTAYACPSSTRPPRTRCARAPRR